MANDDWRTRLDKLATYCERIVRGEIPMPVDRFSMSQWFDNRYFIEECGECGTAACFCGFATFAGVTEAKPITDGEWVSLANTMIPMRSNRSFNWLFSSHWPNDLVHACARARYLLAHGKPPGWFSDAYEATHCFDEQYLAAVEPYLIPEVKSG